jgi:FdhD protein
MGLGQSPLSLTSPSRGEISQASPIVQSQRLAFRNHAFAAGSRALAEETAIALSYNGSTHAVLMATPQDLTAFAIGFSLTERIIDSVEAIESIEIIETQLGLDVQLRLANDVAERLAARRRSMAGPVGCGLCGVESLEAALREIVSVDQGVSLTPAMIADAITTMTAKQPINAETHAVHAAGYYIPGQGMIAVCEDVGRHNALDKLIGVLTVQGVIGSSGAVILTSRVSVEMVQKTAIAGAGMIIAISAPTALAVRTATEAGITLVAVARGNEFEVFTHPRRVMSGVETHAA